MGRTVSIKTARELIDEFDTEGPPSTVMVRKMLVLRLRVIADKKGITLQQLLKEVLTAYADGEEGK